jgi:2-dehydropantoate 2-reductase
MSEVAIWGAGAIGGTVGAWMARAGTDVVLVDRDEAHVRAIQQHGLLVDGVREAFRVDVPCVTPDRVEGSFGLVFLAVKCMHTAGALEALTPHLAEDGAVVSLQNGLNEDTIAQRIGTERTIGCFVNFSADWQEPGHIEHGGEHPLYVGELDGQPTERIDRVRRLLAQFGKTVVTDNIWGYLWSKLVYASVLFGTALVDAPVHEIVRRPDCGEALFRLGQEALRVPDAKGVRLERLEDFWPEEYRGDDWRPAMERVAVHFEGQIKVRTGVWRDLAVRHRRTEVDCQAGELVRQGAEVGAELPLNRRLIELIHEVEEGRRPMSWENLPTLIGARPRLPLPLGFAGNRPLFRPRKRTFAGDRSLPDLSCGAGRSPPPPPHRRAVADT